MDKMNKLMKGPDTMKLVQKAFKLPEPLAEAIRTLGYEERKSQTFYVVAALADYLERHHADKDSRIAAFVAEYRANENPEPETEELPPEEYR